MLIHESRWNELLKSGSKWNDNPSWGKDTATLDAIAETIDGGGDVNQAPDVDAGADQVVANNDTSADLDATVTDDGLPDSSSLSYSWTQVSGPTSVINSANAEDTAVSLPQVGSYVFRMEASDGELSASDG